MFRSQKSSIAVALLFTSMPSNSFAQECSVDQLAPVQLSENLDFEDLASEADYIRFTKKTNNGSDCALQLASGHGDASAVFRWPGFLGIGGASADFTVHDWDADYCIEVGSVWKIRSLGNFSPEHILELQRVDADEGVTVVLSANRDLELGKIGKKTGIEPLTCAGSELAPENP